MEGKIKNYTVYFNSGVSYSLLSFKSTHRSGAILICCYILFPPKLCSSSGAKSFFFSFIATVHIYCSWELKKKKKNLLNFSLLFHLKNIFSFFLSFSLSNFSSFFLFPSHFFFLSLIYSLLHWFVLDLHLHLHHRFVLGSSSSPSHAADLFHPVLHLTADPISIADLSFIVEPSSTGTAFIELKSAFI